MKRFAQPLSQDAFTSPGTGYLREKPKRHSIVSVCRSRIPLALGLRGKLQLVGGQGRVVRVSSPAYIGCPGSPGFGNRGTGQMFPHFPHSHSVGSQCRYPLKKLERGCCRAPGPAKRRSFLSERTAGGLVSTAPPIRAQWPWGTGCCFRDARAGAGPVRTPAGC